MSNIGVAIQQSVGILGQLLAPRNQIPPNAMQQMHTPTNFQAPPQQLFQQTSSSSGTYSRREKGSNVTKETCFEDEKPVINCKNEKVGEILVIIILFMFDETFFAE